MDVAEPLPVFSSDQSLEKVQAILVERAIPIAGISSDGFVTHFVTASAPVPRAAPGIMRAAPKCRGAAFLFGSAARGLFRG